MPTQTEIRQQITQQIVAALEKDQIPWRCPWRRSPNAGRPTSVANLRPYSGINPLVLQSHAYRFGFRSKFWGTLQQWQRWGCTIKRRPDDVSPGALGAKIVFYRPITKAVIDRATGDEDQDKFCILRTWTVFNAEQVEGLVAGRFLVVEPKNEQDHRPDFIPAEELIAATGATIHYGGEQALYSRPRPDGSWPEHWTGDEIFIPERSSFDSIGSFYETICHELAHWSEVRLKWDGSYAMGELIAEMAACFLSAELGIPDGEDLTNHSRYLSSWLTAMRSDPKFIFQASSQASKVTDFLLGFVNKEQPQAEQVEVA